MESLNSYLIKVAFIKLLSIAQKKQDGDITGNQMHKLVLDLVHHTTSEISRHAPTSFVTDN